MRRLPIQPWAPQMRKRLGVVVVEEEEDMVVEVEVKVDMEGGC